MAIGSDRRRIGVWDARIGETFRAAGTSVAQRYPLVERDIISFGDDEGSGSKLNHLACRACSDGAGYTAESSEPPPIGLTVAPH